MIPDKISIKTVELIDGEPKVVEKDYFYSFGYNTINSFRKAEGMTIADVADIFGEFAKDEKDRDVEKVAEANEYFGKLFYHAIEEGMRRVKLTNELTEKDIQAFLNDPENFDSTKKIADVYSESSVQAGEETEKKNQ